MKYQIGGTFLTDVGNIYRITKIEGIAIDAFCIYGNNQNNSKKWSIHSIKSFPYTPPYEIPTEQKQWKKEDFLYTKIEVNTPEKSERFQELMFTLGIKWFDGKTIQFLNANYLYIDSCGILTFDNDKSFFVQQSEREIEYKSIFNNQSITTTNENNSKNINDTSSAIATDSNTKRTGTAISFGSKGQIANGVRYTGNQIEGRRAICKSIGTQISFQAISF